MLHEVLPSCLPPANMIWRLMKEGAGAGHSGEPGDGGLFLLTKIHREILRKSMRAAETNDIVRALPEQPRWWCYARYWNRPSLRDDPRGMRATAQLMGVSEHECRQFEALVFARLQVIDWTKDKRLKDERAERRICNSRRIV